MRTTSSLLASALVLGAVSAAPSSSGRLALRALRARQVTYDASCSDAQKAKAQKAFGDLATFSNTVLNVPATINGQTVYYQQSAAFSNYFEPGDFNTVQQMHQVIYNNRLPADSDHPGSYTFEVQCGDNMAPDACNGNIAATNSAMGDSVMILCDAFFDSNTPQTVNDLDSKTQDEWCQTNEHFSFFNVAGETLYHEITHLDIIGAQAGLIEHPADPNDPNDSVRSHGSLDCYDVGGDFDKEQYEDEDGRPLPIEQASRLLKALWEDYKNNNNNYHPLVARVENAESYAASAMEWYFQVLCGFPNIEE